MTTQRWLFYCGFSKLLTRDATKDLHCRQSHCMIVTRPSFQASHHHDLAIIFQLSKLMCLTLCLEQLYCLLIRALFYR
jgi:hypothetical protein